MDAQKQNFLQDLKLAGLNSGDLGTRPSICFVLLAGSTNQVTSEWQNSSVHIDSPFQRVHTKQVGCNITKEEESVKTVRMVATSRSLVIFLLVTFLPILQTYQTHMIRNQFWDRKWLESRVKKVQIGNSPHLWDGKWKMNKWRWGMYGKKGMSVWRKYVRSPQTGCGSPSSPEANTSSSEANTTL